MTTPTEWTGYLSTGHCGELQSKDFLKVNARLEEFLAGGTSREARVDPDPLAPPPPPPVTSILQTQIWQSPFLNEKHPLVSKRIVRETQ